jgi:hypothetical protein
MERQAADPLRVGQLPGDGDDRRDFRLAPLGDGISYH